MNVISQRHIVNASEEKIYTSISDCRNFEKFLPQEMKDVEVTAESCKFTIPGLTTLTLSIVEKREFTKVSYQATNDKNIPINLIFHIINENNTNNIEVEIDVGIPAFLSAMVKKPLQNAVDMIAEKIPQAIENN
ncbi:MAG: hypothetical protein J6W84_09155 [Bacteroidales bacterium]|nr:hypothetical protein [Bacteroidales bacterium]